MAKTLQLFVFCVTLVDICAAADVLFVDHFKQPSVPAQQVELACRFYGLELRHLSLETEGGASRLIAAIQASKANAVVFEANALAQLDNAMFLSAMEEKKIEKVLIMGVTPAIDSLVLRRWSGGALLGCKEVAAHSKEAFCEVGSLKNFTRELAGQKMPFSAKAAQRIQYFVLDQEETPQTIFQIENTANDFHLPIFVKADVDGREIFWSTAVETGAASEVAGWQFTNSSFIEIAPVLMFLRYSLGDRCWHRTGDDANFCIDDPWLTEPYGHLRYQVLLQEMQHADFHTTIAFIPWNYDRSDAAVVSLFLNNPNRFSICLHGNNHDQREFNESKSLPQQELNIQQALARMEMFHELTGIAYDRVMVFPLHIAPERTLGLLKKYNFLATVNGDNLPLGSTMPTDPCYSLRPGLAQFENFLSLKRYSPYRSEHEIALDLFLDNPLLFYTHQDFFARGVDAFNPVAEVVNRLGPEVEWRSLGDIARHYYLERMRGDGHYDLLAFGNDFILENPHQHAVTYFILKEESFSPSVRKLAVDDQTHSYERDGKFIRCTVVVPAKASIRVSIEYENDVDLAAIDLGKTEMLVTIIRKLSDFRDMTLSTNAVGIAFFDFYYSSGLSDLGLFNLASGLSIVFILIMLGGWRLRKRLKHARV